MFVLIIIQGHNYMYGVLSTLTLGVSEMNLTGKKFTYAVLAMTTKFSFIESHLNDHGDMT